MIKLHKMTWGELTERKGWNDRNIPLETVIPETYWFVSESGAWYEVEKGFEGWNITDILGRDEGHADTLKEIRSWTWC